MFRTILLAIFFWIIMLVSVAFLPVFHILKLFSWKAASFFIKHYAKYGVKLMFKAGGIKTSVEGIKNIPASKKICFISNHQSYLDIPVLVDALPRQIGFAAKKELNNIPVINIWMHALGCVIIDRRKPSDSIDKMKQRIDKIEKNKPLVIFPEGTRSKSQKMRNFKTGGISLLPSKNIYIVPVTIDGSYRLLEERSLLKPGKIRVTIHPPIKTENIDSEDFRKLAKKLENIIQKPLQN